MSAFNEHMASSEKSVEARRFTITIDLTADTICPWCAIARARLLRVIQRLKLRKEMPWTRCKFLIRWQPFVLDSSLPVWPEEPHSKEDLFSRLYGENNVAQVQSMLRERGAECGITFDFRGKVRSSKDVQRLILHAESTANYPTRQLVLSKIMQDYHENGIDVSERDYLARLGIEHFLLKDAESAREFFDSEDSLAELTRRLAETKDHSTLAIPTVAFNDRYRVPGAQPEAVYEEIMRYLARDFEEMEQLDAILGVDSQPGVSSPAKAS